MKIFLNGRLVADEEACIRPNDRGFTLGDGIFETMRAQAGRIHCRDAHLDRLRQSAERLMIPVPLAPRELCKALDDTLAENGLATGDAGIRLTLTRGPGPRGVPPPAKPDPTVMISAAPLPQSKGDGIRAYLVGVRRNEHSPLARIKSINYLENVLARLEADSHGADDALLCNLAGHLAETTVANLFLVIDGNAWTPPLSDGPLPGVTRARILALGPRSPCPVGERRLRSEDIAAASEAFVTNSLVEVQPLVAVDGRGIGDGRPGRYTAQFQDAYAESLLSDSQ